MSSTNFIEGPAIFVASAVGGLWLWLYLLLSGQSLVSSTLLLVLLLPFLGLASSVVFTLLVLPMWWLFRTTSFSTPHRFAVLVALATVLLSLVVPAVQDASLRQHLQEVAFAVVWLCSMAAVYSKLAGNSWRQEHEPSREA